MTLTVRAVPPFDFDLSAMIFSEGDRQIRRYEAGRFWQVIRANGKLVLITVKASGTAEKPAVPSTDLWYFSRLVFRRLSLLQL